MGSENDKITDEYIKLYIAALVAGESPYGDKTDANTLKDYIKKIPTGYSTEY